MDYAQFINIIKANMPFDKGNMFNNGADYFDTPYFFKANYNNDRVPYIDYNEFGTIYTKKNKGFISQKTVGVINRATWSESLGLPFDNKPYNDEVATRNNSILEQMGVMTNVTTRDL